MPGTMWCTVNSNLFHKRSPIAVIVIAIKKSFSVLCMKKIFAIGTRLIPVFIVRQELICNRNFSDAIFSFTVDYIKILKQSGHYKTVLLSFMYCCFHLLVALCFAIVIIIYGLKSVVVFNLICGFTADTLVIVGECLYLLLCIVIKVE